MFENMIENGIGLKPITILMFLLAKIVIEYLMGFEGAMTFSITTLTIVTTLRTGKPYRRGRISTVDLLFLTSLDQLLFIL